MEQDLAEDLRRAGYAVSLRFDMSRVLVIDNDPDTRSLVGILLRNKGVETDAAEHGGEGLAKARVGGHQRRLNVLSQEARTSSEKGLGSITLGLASFW